MSSAWKKLRSEFVQALISEALESIDPASSDDDIDAPPKFSINDIYDFAAQDADAPFDEFEPFEHDAFEGDPMELDEAADFEPFSDFSDDGFQDFENELNRDLDPQPQPYELPDHEDYRMLNGNEDDEAANLFMCILLLYLAKDIEQMRGTYDRIRKSRDWFIVSMSWAPDWFRDRYRLLEENPIFQSTGNKPQRPVAHQLACFLLRYGKAGSVATISNTSLSLGVGTVFIYCERVTRALRMVGLECVAWPDEERKSEMKAVIKDLSGIPGVIGIGDGSLFKLTEKPRREGNSYFTYKNFPGINVFFVVDFERRFIAHEGGWAGCKSDRTTFRSSYIWQHRGELIRRGEILLVDKGFFTSPYTCRPYDIKDLDRMTPVERRQKRAFNRRFSKVRVIVEHAFGLLKKRFPSLTLMGTSHNIQTVHRLVEALIVLHNLCIDYDDKHSPDEYDVEEDDELPDILHRFPGHIDIQRPLQEGGWNGHETQAELLREGNRVREEIQQASERWAARQ
ncbi:DDE superfamily endonuclease [Ceratobasidium sp. AG-Ba]|nr:DDE superfamily endonuclease [Ceratobasidium sp. AG-Ba]QRW06880.1 DDE superfamily endonuclease [Ceratobasidium sp. AG-Ba]